MGNDNEHRVISATGPATPKLSSRGVEVLFWIAQGKSDAEIAEILSIHEGTVNFHVEKAKRALKVRTRIQAVVAAMRLGYFR